MVQVQTGGPGQRAGAILHKDAPKYNMESVIVVAVVSSISLNSATKKSGPSRIKKQLCWTGSQFSMINSENLLSQTLPVSPVTSTNVFQPCAYKVPENTDTEVTLNIEGLLVEPVLGK